MKPRERIYIVPTWAGFVFALVVFAIFSVGYYLEGFGGSPQILVISLLVAGILAMIETNDNLRGLVVTSCRAEPVAAGEDALLHLAVTNRSDRERLGLQVRFREGWKLRVVGSLPVLRAGETLTVTVRQPTLRRGRHAVPTGWITSSLPVGLCFAWKAFADCGRYHVYPRGRSWRPAPEGAGLDGGDGRAGAVDVTGHRVYQAGDPLSRIDWRVFARRGHLAVRTFEGAGGGGLKAFGWEDTAFLEQTEDRLEQLSFWVSDCVRRQQPFILNLGPGSFTERTLSAGRAALSMFPERP